MYIDAASRTQSIYDQHFELWIRDEPTILSDYTARPRVLETLGNVEGMDILDLGCGEGYLARKLARAGANSICGIDLSSEMVKAASKQNQEDQLPITYQDTDLRQWSAPSKAFDWAIAVFLFNYLTIDESAKIITKAKAALKPQGQLVFTLPHPSLPWLREAHAPFYFERPQLSYQEARDQSLSGRIWHRNGNSVPVQCFHKTLSDIYHLAQEAEFRILSLSELYVTAQHIKLDPQFFGPLQGTPLHVMVHAEAT